MLGLMQLAKKIPFEDEKTLNILRGAYLLSNIIILGLYAYVGMVINKKNGRFCSREDAWARVVGLDRYLWGSVTFAVSLLSS